MKIKYNTHFCLSEQEVKEIIANWFETTQGVKISCNQVVAKIEHQPYCEPEFKEIVIVVEQEKEVDAV